MKFIFNACPEPNSQVAFEKAIIQRICDPGSFLPRKRDGSATGFETVESWGARAVAAMFQPIESSDGSAQPVKSGVIAALVNIAKETHPRINPNSSPAECRDRDELIRRAEGRRHECGLPSCGGLCPDCARKNASYGSAQPQETITVLNTAGETVTTPTRGVSEFRALLDSAKGVTADQLELTLARGHLKEAARAFEAVRAENNQFRAYLRVAGSLLGRADADPIKLAQKVEAGIIAVNEDLRITKEEVESWRQTHVADVAKLEKERDWLDASRKESKEARERRDDLEREVAKARRVIVGNVVVEDNGSLLDMLNAVLTKLTEERVQCRQHAEQAATDRANLAHADEKIAELQQFIASNAPQVSGSSGAL